MVIKEKLKMASTFIPIFIGLSIGAVICVPLIMGMAEEEEKKQNSTEGGGSRTGGPWTAVRVILSASVLVSASALIVALVIGDAAFIILVALMGLFSGIALALNWSPRG